MSDPTPSTMPELLARIARGWNALQDVLAPLTEAQLTRPADPAEKGSWSIKDHLAHLAAWERSSLAALRGQPRDLALGVEAATYDSEDEDRINAEIYERSQGRPLSDVLGEMREAHRQMLLVLEKTDYAALRDEYEGSSVLARITGNTYEHYEEHLPWIQTALKSQR